MLFQKFFFAALAIFFCQTSPSSALATQTFQISKIVLINKDTNSVVRELRDGAAINRLNLPPRVAIRARPIGPVGSVGFKLNGTLKTENLAPFEIDFPTMDGAFNLRVTSYQLDHRLGTVGNVLNRAFSVTSLAANEPPTAVNDDMMIMQNMMSNIQPLINDTDPEQKQLKIVAILQNPSAGVATIQPDGQSISYTPNTGFTGNDLIVYQIADDKGLLSQANINLTIKRQVACSTVGLASVVVEANALAQRLPQVACGSYVQVNAGVVASDITVSQMCPQNLPIVIAAANGLNISDSQTNTIVKNLFSLTGDNLCVMNMHFKGVNAKARIYGNSNKLIGNKFEGWGHGQAITLLRGSFGEIAYNMIGRPAPWPTTVEQYRAENSYPLRMGIRTVDYADGPIYKIHYRAWLHHNYFHNFPAKPDCSSLDSTKKPRENGDANYNCGQSDAIEIGQTQRRGIATGEYLPNWIIEYNYIDQHLQQAYGSLIDFKSGGNVFRYNTVKNSFGSIGFRTGPCNRMINNDLRSSNVIVLSGHHLLLGNILDTKKIIIETGNVASCELGTYQAAKGVQVFGNSSALTVGQTNREVEVTDVTVAEHTGKMSVMHSDAPQVLAASPIALPAIVPVSFEDVGPEALKTLPLWSSDPGEPIQTCECH